MKLKHVDILIPENEPFKNCKLNRKKYAEILTSIVGSYADGFVLAINNEWGTGKTTFVKMWQQHLKNKEFKTLYFNAWENDYDSDPLVALLSELKTLTKDKSGEVIKSLMKKGATLSKKIVPLLLEALAKKYINTDVLSEGIGKIADGAMDIFEEEVKDYANKKKGLVDFKSELEKYVAKETNGKPLVFIIDELDRCRPDYAVEVLEQVKHFFSIPGIVFVLSIDKIQLGNAVRGFYGSEHLNADEYLRRFIDIEYRIPPPNSQEICIYFYQYFQLYEFFPQVERIKYEEEGNRFIEFASIVAAKENLGLRQLEKIFAHARLVAQIIKQNNYRFPSVLFLLIYLREYDISLFEKIKNRQITYQDIASEIENRFLQYVHNDNMRLLIYTEGLLLFLYCSYYQEIDYNYHLLEYDKTTNINSLTFESKIGGDKYSLLKSIEKIYHDGPHAIKLSYLLDKIELMEALNF